MQFYCSAHPRLWPRSLQIQAGSATGGGVGGNITLSPGTGDTTKGIVEAFGDVTDAVSCTFMGALTGHESTVCPVVYTGVSWVGG